MKIAATAVVVVVAALATTVSADSACNAAKNAAACAQVHDQDSGLACEWCEAGAIPSECMSPAQAAQLPPGVFDCQVPSAGDSFSSKTHHYQFVSHQQHSLRIQHQGFDDLCDGSVPSIAGYMDLKGSDYDQQGEDKHLFFWMFEKREDFDDNDDDDDSEIPFVVWLTGGPGCSSTLALLTENGPCTVNPDGETTSINPASWTEAAHVLWLDQPAGVGYSYGKETDKSEEMVAEDAYYFLQAFFQTFPEYQSSPLFIVGESYAGHYVPAIAHRIYQGNSEKRSHTITLNYAGLAIGNGLTSPAEQYPAYPDMVWNNSHGIQVVDEATYEAMQAAVPRCVSLIDKCNAGDSFVNTFACQTAFLVCNTALTSPYQMTGLNPYDIRKECEVPPLCYDVSHVQAFLNSDRVKSHLNVDPEHAHSWESCNFGINQQFHTDWMKDFSREVADLLEAGYPALIYVGDVDFICNYIGNEKWTYDLAWSGQAAFQAAPVHPYSDTGLARTANGFTFLQVFDAGHMVPSDQPERSLEMIRHFIAGGEF